MCHVDILSRKGAVFPKTVCHHHVFDRPSAAALAQDLALVLLSKSTWKVCSPTIQCLYCFLSFLLFWSKPLRDIRGKMERDLCNSWRNVVFTENSRQVIHIFLCDMVVNWQHCNSIIWYSKTRINTTSTSLIIYFFCITTCVCFTYNASSLSLIIHNNNNNINSKNNKNTKDKISTYLFCYYRSKFVFQYSVFTLHQKNYFNIVCLLNKSIFLIVKCSIYFAKIFH